MAQISNFYQESEVTIGTAKYKLSAPLNTIYNVNDELDLSIAQTAWNKQQFFGISPRNSSTEAYNKRVPTTSVTSFTPTLQYKATAAPASANFYNVAYNPKVDTEQISMYPCIVSGSANCFIGTQYMPDVDPYKTTSDLKVFTDFKYGEILFVTPNIEGWKKSEFSFDNMYSSGNKLTVTSIPWEDFIANPSDYYVVGDVIPASTWIWDGSKYTSRNNVKPAYIINSKWLKGFQVYGFLPDGCEFYTQNFKAGDLPAVPQISVNNYRDGLTTRMPWGLTTINSNTASIFNYSFIDYTGVESNWDFDAMPAPETIETGTYQGEYFPPKEFDSDQFKARIRNIGKAQRTADNRYGYTSFTTYFDIVYDGQLAYDLLSGLGMYFINTNDSTKFNTYNPDTIQNCEYAYLGEMDANGYTTCRFIHGEELGKYEGWNGKGGYVNNNFDPSKPIDGEDDESDDINFGYMFSGAGAFTNLWYCTQQDLTDLRQWFLGADTQHPIPEGFDPMPSIIGLFQYPISLGGDVLEEIKFRTSSGLIVSTGVQAARGLSTNLKFDLGSINIPARMKERGVPFLDYESTVECYVPFCGVFQLDTQTVIGKTLSCTLWMSPATGECNCIVYTISNGIKAPVAYGSGNMSSQIPISSNGWGSYAAALKNATIQKNQIISSALTGGVSSIFSGAGNQATMVDLGEQIAGQSVGSAFGAVGMALGGAGAALGLLSTGVKAYQDINAANVGIRHLKASNGTSINGAFSGQSAWNYPMTPYVKISRPHYKKPNNYAHTQGIPLVEAKKLSECSGFTMCVGADLTGITATQTERDIISAYLTNGIIV